MLPHSSQESSWISAGSITFSPVLEFGEILVQRFIENSPFSRTLFQYFFLLRRPAVSFAEVAKWSGSDFEVWLWFLATFHFFTGPLVRFPFEFLSRLTSPSVDQFLGLFRPLPPCPPVTVIVVHTQVADPSQPRGDAILRADGRVRACASVRCHVGSGCVRLGPQFVPHQ